MTASPGPGGPPPAVDTGPISVPELRDYHRINAELVRRLQLGQRYVRLDGVEGHRLLLFGLRGPWHAVVELAGNAGPELAAEMDAPGVTVVCRGSAADGAGRSLVSGTLLILGRSGVALGYGQIGGLIVAAGDAGARAGLLQRGGDLVLLGPSGSLSGEGQLGGRLLFRQALAGPNPGHGRRSGRLVDIGQVEAGDGRGPGPHVDPGLVRLLDAAQDLASRHSSNE
ncbi:glutamate synthase [Aquisphaera insulae]|uniref:glutamate synthase n=1 Tax=Aquisphaera insulae TaxID=2712864 RepID=UPI0013EA6556|nr:glutamate synthase [Aquisphaera insulae]